MLEYLQRFKKSLLMMLAGLSALVMVYLIGRRNRKGEVNLQIASQELQHTIDKQATIMQDLDKLQKQKVDIISDIAAEKLTRMAIEERNAKKSDQSVIDMLRKRGSIK